MINLSTRRGRAVIALAAALTLVAGVAEARVGRGGGFGSRGGRTFDAPPVTRTAPNPAGPIERSQAPQNQFQNRPAAPPVAQAAQPRFGFGTGLVAGLFGAGLLGMLFGGGFFGGLSGIGSFLGLLIQIGLVVLIASLALRWFRRRQEPQMAGAYARSGAGDRPPGPAGSAGLGGLLGGGRGTSPARPVDAPRRAGTSEAVAIGEGDFAAFERALVEIQDAYSRGDVAALWERATPEMAGYIQEELNDNAARGVVNRVGGVRLLQGDLAEAWREGGIDYATVAMRFAHTDSVHDKATGRLVEGDPDRPIEATELWTFRRDGGGPWKLSAIQQVR